MKISCFRKVSAKLFDYAFCFLAFAFTILLTPFANDDMYYYYIMLATPLIWIIPETFLLTTWGSTPGYSLFGIAPRNADGSKLSWKQALRISLFSGKDLGIVWGRCEKSLPRFITRLAIGCAIVITAMFGKAILQFPKEFERQVSNKGWVQFTSSDNDFTAEFPCKPKIEQKQLEIPEAKRTLDYQEVKSDHTDQVTYSVSGLELPKKWRIFSSSTILKGALSVILDHNLPWGAKLISKEITNHGEHPAINFHIRHGDTEIKGRLVLVAGGKLYKVEFSQAIDTKAEEAGLAFINSFKPLNPNLTE